MTSIAFFKNHFKYQHHLHQHLLFVKNTPPPSAFPYANFSSVSFQPHLVKSTLLSLNNNQKILFTFLSKNSVFILFFPSLVFMWVNVAVLNLLLAKPEISFFFQFCLCPLAGHKGTGVLHQNSSISICCSFKCSFNCFVFVYTFYYTTTLRWFRDGGDLRSKASPK